MEILEKTVNGRTLRFLNTEAFEREDWEALSASGSQERNVCLSLSALDKLPYFSALEALYLTGGSLGPAGFAPLYAAAALKCMVLDYEETDAGFARHSGDLGRVVIPKETRRRQLRRVGDPPRTTWETWQKFGFAMSDLAKRMGRDRYISTETGRPTVRIREGR